MLDFEIEELTESHEWRDVLTAYREAHQSEKQVNPEFDGWLPRIAGLEFDDEDVDLSKVHGKLIALGFLKFQIANRDLGMVYQLSPAGRQAIDNLAVGDDSDREAPDQDDEAPENEIVVSEFSDDHTCEANVDCEAKPQLKIFDVRSRRRKLLSCRTCRRNGNNIRRQNKQRNQLRCHTCRKQRSRRFEF